MIGQRSRAGEHEAMRKKKKQFMTHWDGLLTKPGERILLLAATNRPFDLDEAIIRRFARRGLTTKGILHLLFYFSQDHGWSTIYGEQGNDIETLLAKNLCTAAAYRPVRELIPQERLKGLEKKSRWKSKENSEDAAVPEDKEERVITIRPLNIEDFKEAKNQVAASFASEGSIMAELKQWNELYGEGGSRKKGKLSYLL